MENKKFEIGQKTLQTDTQIVVISFFRFKGIFQKIWAFSQMGFARKKLKNIKEISFFKLFGSGTGEGFTPYPNTSVYAILSVWNDIKIKKNKNRKKCNQSRINSFLFIVFELFCWQAFKLVWKPFFQMFPHRQRSMLARFSFPQGIYFR